MRNMSVLDQPRQPAGAPTGGQFAETSGAESDFTQHELIGELDAEDLLKACRRAVRIAYHRVAPQRAARGESLDSATDLDDLASEVTVRIIERHGSTEITINGPAAAYAQGIAQNVVRETVRGGHRRSDIKARAILDRMKNEFANKHGRLPTASETKTMVREILDTWDSSDLRGRPSFNFDSNTARTVSIEQVSDAEWATLKAAVSGTEDDDYAHRAEVQLESGGRKGNASARALAYNMLAESKRAPMAKRACMSKHAVTKARALIGTTEGGLNQVISDWERGVDTPATEALFQPFGSATEADKRAVIDLLKASPYTAELWDSALVFADSRFSIGDEN